MRSRNTDGSEDVRSSYIYYTEDRNGVAVSQDPTGNGRTCAGTLRVSLQPSSFMDDQTKCCSVGIASCSCAFCASFIQETFGDNNIIFQTPNTPKHYTVISYMVRQGNTILESYDSTVQSVPKNYSHAG